MVEAVPKILRRRASDIFTEGPTPASPDPDASPSPGTPRSPDSSLPTPRSSPTADRRCRRCIRPGRQVALPLADVMRQQPHQQIRHSPDEFARLRKRPDVSCHRRILPRQLLVLRNVVRWAGIARRTRSRNRAVRRGGTRSWSLEFARVGHTPQPVPTPASMRTEIAGSRAATGPP